MNFKVIVTLGPSIVNSKKLKDILSHGPCIFRINGAHVEPDNICEIVEEVREVLPEAEFMLDLPGNKVRTKGLTEPLRLVKNEYFDIHSHQLNFPEFSDYVKEGDIIFAHDSIYRLEVKEVEGKTIRFLSHSDGFLLGNKGLHIKGLSDGLPFLFEKDYKLIEKACKYSIDHLALSFVRKGEDIVIVKDLLNKYTSFPHIIAKVETSMALENIESIFDEVDSILIDRGDLSSDIGIHNLAYWQGVVINKARSKGKNIFLATQFLKNMEKSPLPCHHQK